MKPPFQKQSSVYTRGLCTVTWVLYENANNRAEVYVPVCRYVLQEIRFIEAFLNSRY